jgi:hypothetical protein
MSISLHWTPMHAASTWQRRRIDLLVDSTCIVPASILWSALCTRHRPACRTVYVVVLVFLFVRACTARDEAAYVPASLIRPSRSIQTQQCAHTHCIGAPQLANCSRPVGAMQLLLSTVRSLFYVASSACARAHLVLADDDESSSSLPLMIETPINKRRRTAVLKCLVVMHAWSLLFIRPG